MLHNGPCRCIHTQSGLQNVFRFTWEGKKWEIFPLTECVWITFVSLAFYAYPDAADGDYS